MPEFPNIILYDIPFFILAMLVELVVTIKEHINTYETKDIFSGKKSLKNRWLYLIKPPGWKHDGTGKISEELQAEWVKRH